MTKKLSIRLEECGEKSYKGDSKEEKDKAKQNQVVKKISVVVI